MVSEYYGMVQYKDIMIPTYSTVVSGGKVVSYIPFEQINAGIELINSFNIIINEYAVNENEILRSPEILDTFLKLQNDYNVIMKSVNSGEIKTLITNVFANTNNYAEVAYTLKTKYNVSTFKELFEKLKFQLDMDKQAVIDKINEIYYTVPIVPRTLEEQLRYGVNSVKYEFKDPNKALASTDKKFEITPVIIAASGIITALLIWRFKK